jgi:hypothetical protein
MILIYDEFLSSARKHLKTCLVIRDSLNSLDESNIENNSQIKLLTLNLYYISGYVIECSIKYGIYVCIGYDKTACVKQLDTPDIKYSRQIKNHRYNKYEDILKSKFSGIILVDNKSNIPQPIKNLYSNWDADIRYCCNDIPEKFKYCDNKEHVLEFFNYAEKIFKIIQEKLR